MRVEDLTKFEGECPNIVVFGTYMDIRVPLTKKWKKIMVATAYFREQGKVPVFEDSNCRLIKL